MPLVELRGKAIPYRVRTSKRAKRISVRYSQSAGLEVVYPSSLRAPEPETILQERADWILSAMDKLAAVNGSRPRREYRQGEAFLFRGAPYRLLLEYSPAPALIQARLTDDRLALTLPDTARHKTRDAIRQAVEAFYRQHARDYLPRRLDDLAARYGFKYAQLRIKNQKTRWGSCSAKGNINLNLRLMMAPDDAIDYVLIHELCHLRELNHSPAFWALVESVRPDYRHWKAWFKENGPCLIL